MRASLVVGGVLVAVATASAASAGLVDTSLRITFWASGTDARPAARWTLRCNPPRGTLPRPTAACRKLARGGRSLFDPVPPDVACTEIYGGPQRARVLGSVAGKRVWATVTRVNGCEIARWDRLAPWLVPRGGVNG